MRKSHILATMLMLTSCGYSDSRMAHQAQINMQGMTALDLQSCAGVPDRTKKIDEHTEIFTYGQKNDGSGGVEVTLPIVGGGYTIGNSGSQCAAHFRMVDNKVAGLFYSGNNDRAVGEDGICAPIIRGCMRRPQASMIPLTADTVATSSAFRQPPAPPPSPAATPLGVPTGSETIRMPTVGR